MLLNRSGVAEYSDQTGKLGAESGQVDFVQSDIAIGYLRSRVFAALSLILSGVILALAWDWQGGWVVAAASLLVLVDGVFRLRTGSPYHVMTPLLLDITVASLTIMLTDLPRATIAVPLFYDLVSAVFALSRLRSLLIASYAAAWSFAVVSLDLDLIDVGLNPREHELALLVAVLIYFAATYLMTSTAASAVRERSQLNAELREKESRLRTVIDSTPIVLYAIDNNGNFTLSEGPGLRSLGLEPGQVVGMDFRDLYRDNPAVLDMVEMALHSDEETLHEVVIGDITFAVRHQPQIDESGVRRGTVGVAVDVTAEATYRSELEQQIRSKDEFVAAVSHELRTPLSVVYGLGEELHRNSSDLTVDEIAELHALLSQQAGEVVAIVEDLLVAARADMDRLVVVGEVVDVGRQIETVLQPLSGINIAATATTDGPVEAWCDGSRTRQILRNLVTNATRHGGTAIELSYGCEGDRVLVEVRDDGAGVPRGEESDIFNAYHRSPAAAGNPASIGLGLTVARTLARRMGGDLIYQRRDGWSVFRLTLPSVATRTAT